MGFLVLAGLVAGCAPSANVAQEKEALLRLDREWSTTSKDPNKFVSYYAPDASLYPQGMPLVTGAGPIRETYTQMATSPGYALEFVPAKAEVSASGEVGYTTGTYKMMLNGVADNGKYVAIWKKQPDGSWKVVEDIFNSNGSSAPPIQHLVVAGNAVTWGDPPPFLPAGAKVAAVSGDPSKAGPFVLRVQMPAGYRIAAHWHPTDEHVTVLSGTMALGMGDSWTTLLQTCRWASTPSRPRWALRDGEDRGDDRIHATGRSSSTGNPADGRAGQVMPAGALPAPASLQGRAESGHDWTPPYPAQLANPAGRREFPRRARRGSSLRQIAPGT
jgi:ketosteroid isomerase-like protein